MQRSLSEIKRSFRGLDSSMKITSNNMRFGEKSVSSYEKGIKSLNSDIEKQRKNLDDLGKKHADAVREQGANSKAATQLATEYNKQADNLNRLEHQLEQATQELKEMQREQRYAESGWGRLGNSFGKVGNQLKDIGRNMKDVGKSMSMYITAPLVGVGAAAVGIGIDFEKSMSKVQALSGASTDDMAKMEKQARELGATTVFSASDAADGMAFLAMAGYEVSDVMDSMPGLLDLAAAGQMDLGNAADITTNIMSSFGIEAEKTGHVADVLAKASSSANTDVGQLGEAIKYLGPVANSLGWELEESASAVMTLSNAGIQGSMAGQAFASSLSRLAKPTKAMQGVIDDLGISFFDAEGTMKPLPEVMGELERGTKGMTDEQKSATLSTLFGAEAYKHWSVLLEDGSEVLADNTKMLIEADGAAQQMADTMTDNLAGDWNQFTSAMSELGLQIYDILQPALRGVVQWITEAVQWVQNLSPQFKILGVIIAGLAAALGPVLVVGGIFLSVIGNIMTAVDPLTRVIHNAGGIFKLLGGVIKTVASRFTFLLGPVGIAIGIITTLAGIFTYAYKNSETFRDIVHKLGEKLKEVFTKVVDWVTPGFEAIKNFFIDIKDRITTFKNAEGAQLIEAFQNIGSFISDVAGKIWEVIKKAFDKIKWIITVVVMPVVEFVIKQVWGNIKGIITGALDVIMGAVKIFSGLFTGDFKKMWEGVKQLFFGAIKVVWNWIELQFIGRILKGIGGLATGFWNLIKRMWSWVSNSFTSSIRTVYNFVKDSFVGRIVRSIVDFAKNFRTKISDMWNTVKSNFSTKISDIRSSIENSFVGRMIKSVTTLKERFIGIAGDMWKGVNKRFDDIVQGARDLPGRIGGGIKSMAGKVGEGVANVSNNMINGVAKGVNGVVGGINWVLGKIGSEARIKEWKPEGIKVKKNNNVSSGTSGRHVNRASVYADGTGSHPGGAAVLGDGTGSNSGRELTILPNGKTFLSADKPTLYPNLPKGTQVVPARITKQIIPHYAEGTDGFWDWLTIGPKKVMSKVWEKFKPAVSGVGGFFKDIGKGTINFLKNNAFGFLKDKLLDYRDSAVPDGNWNFPGFTLTSRFGKRPSPGGIGSTNHMGIDYAAPTGTLIPSQTGGTVIFSGRAGGLGNLVKISSGGLEYLYGHNSKNLVAVGESVKKGQFIAEVGSTGNSTGPHVHFEIRKNGTPINPMGEQTGGNVSGNVRKWIAAGMSRAGVSGANWLNGLSWIIQKESSGNPRAVGAMTSTGTAKGLMQLKDFNVRGNPFDPVNNVFHGIRYIRSRYGSIGNALSFWKRNNWYGTGGLINNEGLYRLAEEGYPEFVIPTAPNRRTEAMKLLALAGKQIQGNKRPGQLPNVSNNDNSTFEKVIDKLSQQVQYQAQQVQLLTELVLSNRQIADKPVISGRDIKREYDKQDSLQSINHSIMTGRPGGAY